MKNFYSRIVGIGAAKKWSFIIALAIFLAFIFSYVPFLVILYIPWVGVLMLYVVWFILFNPSIRIVGILSIIVIIVACVSSLFQLGIISELLGELLFISLVFIFIKMFTEN